MRVLMVLLGFSLGACASAGLPPAEPDAIARGHQIALAACAACHAVEPGQVSKAPRAPGFASTEMQHVAALDWRVAELTRLGHDGMPPVRLGPGQAEEIVAYIESLSDMGRARPDR